MQGKRQGLETLSRVLLGAWAGACRRRELLWRRGALSRGGRTYRRGSFACSPKTLILATWSLAAGAAVARGAHLVWAHLCARLLRLRQGALCKVPLLLPCKAVISQRGK